MNFTDSRYHREKGVIKIKICANIQTNITLIRV